MYNTIHIHFRKCIYLMILIIVFIGYYKVYYIEGFKGIKGKIKNRRYLN